MRGPEGADYHSSPIIRAELVDLFRHGLHSSWSAKMPKAGAGFFPITSTVGKEFFLLGDEGRVVSSAEVETLSGEYPNMKMVGYRLGVCVSSTRTRARCYLMIPFSVASYL